MPDDRERANKGGLYAQAQRICARVRAADDLLHWLKMALLEAREIRDDAPAGSDAEAHMHDAVDYLMAAQACAEKAREAINAEITEEMEELL
jgi:hypothetical protein